MNDQIDVIKALQLSLDRLGFDPGLIDGLYGSDTENALRRVILARGVMQSSRADEPAQGAMLFQGSAHYPVTEIVVHCAATAPGWMAGASFADRFAEIRRWHMRERGWRNIGCHWLIDRDGARLRGRPETEIGAGVEGHNRGVIHACLIGGAGSSATDGFGRNFTAAQDASLRELIGQIRRRTAIRLVTGHNQYAAKACPGFVVPAWLAAA